MADDLMLYVYDTGGGWQLCCISCWQRAGVACPRHVALVVCTGAAPGSGVPCIECPDCRSTVQRVAHAAIWKRCAGMDV
eukprot:359252-Chlamydomonas_euryale.AAC.7